MRHGSKAFCCSIPISTQEPPLASAALDVLMWNSWAADWERDLSGIRVGRPVLGTSYCSDTHRDRRGWRKRGGEGLGGWRGVVLERYSEGLQSKKILGRRRG